MTEQYKPGDKVPKSGIYRAIHDTEHAQEHEVTSIFHEHFPPCKHC